MGRSASWVLIRCLIRQQAALLCLRRHPLHLPSCRGSQRSGRRCQRRVRAQPCRPMLPNCRQWLQPSPQPLPWPSQASFLCQTSAEPQCQLRSAPLVRMFDPLCLAPCWNRDRGAGYRRSPSTAALNTLPT